MPWHRRGPHAPFGRCPPGGLLQRTGKAGSAQGLDHLTLSPVKTLADWLAHCAAMHPKTMDLSLERTVEVARRLGIHFTVPVITVAGTNGKGSTCAMIESIARHAGYRVGLYQKPELVHFTERCRVGGAAVDEAELLPHFAAVEAARGDTTLTSFEFTTLAIVRLLSMAELDLVILEVGLGGRYDSVNAFDCDCAVITSIDLDHMEWLGPDRESIGAEKAQIMRSGKPAIVSDPLPPDSVVAHGRAIGADLWLVGRDFNHSGDRQQWGWSGRGRRYHGMSYPALRGANQLLNAAGAIAALIALKDRLPINAQAVRTGLGAGGVAGPLPDRPRPAHAGARRGPQPAGGGGAGAQPRRDGLLPGHARRVRRHARQGHRLAAVEDGAAGRCLALLRSAQRTRCQGA